MAASFKECFPKTDEWVRFKPYEQFCRVAARLSAEAIVGPSFSHNETWLNFAVDYTESCEFCGFCAVILNSVTDVNVTTYSVFKTIVVLRSFPEWMYPLLYRLLPSYWRCQGYIKTAKSLLGPQIQELITKNDEESWTPSYEDKDLNVLTWLSVLAKGRDRNPESIAHVQVLIALAAVHTTVLRMVNVLYDITAAGPALLEELREEINTAVNEYGWEGIPYDQLYKLDSVLRESQRMSPLTVLGMKRSFKQSYTFRTACTFHKALMFACRHMLLRMTLSTHQIQNCLTGCGVIARLWRLTSKTEKRQRDFGSRIRRRQSSISGMGKRLAPVDSLPA